MLFLHLINLRNTNITKCNTSKFNKCLICYCFLNHKYWRLFPAIRFKFLFTNLFLQATTGASFSRSIVAVKNQIYKQQAFHYYLGQIKLKDLIIKELKT